MACGGNVFHLNSQPPSHSLMTLNSVDCNLSNQVTKKVSRTSHLMFSFFGLVLGRKKIKSLFKLFSSGKRFPFCIFEMAAMPFPCNALLLCCVNISTVLLMFSINLLVVLALISILILEH